ncbi:hypothetical protein BDD12DRAFT_847772 [Trichophaea hybrida]|nr:hypothetical protein BDD12DRAFT_847772 [Trichophaea hybrida]
MGQEEMTVFVWIVMYTVHAFVFFDWVFFHLRGAWVFSTNGCDAAGISRDFFVRWIFNCLIAFFMSASCMYTYFCTRRMEGFKKSARPSSHI